MPPFFTDIPFAYQLRFHFACQARYRKAVFADPALRETVGRELASLCSEKEYHLLEHRVEPIFLRALVSLRPEHAPSRMAGNLKGVLSRRLKQASPDAFPAVSGGRLWADGYRCVSVGSASTKVLEQYLGRQPDHHGYHYEPFRGMQYRFDCPGWSDETSPVRIRYQVVCETERRVPLFERAVTDRLAPFLRDVLAEKTQCRLARVSFLPDHAHFGVSAAPALAPQEVALALMNESAAWMAEHHAASLRVENALTTWRAAAYIGTIGEVTSRHISNFLGSSS